MHASDTACIIIKTHWFAGAISSWYSVYIVDFTLTYITPTLCITQTSQTACVGTRPLYGIEVRERERGREGRGKEGGRERGREGKGREGEREGGREGGERGSEGGRGEGGRKGREREEGRGEGGKGEGQEGKGKEKGISNPIHNTCTMLATYTMYVRMYIGEVFIEAEVRVAFTQVSSIDST